jgi:protein TonB
MRMNKYLPFTIALLIHALPLTYFLLQKKVFSDAPNAQATGHLQTIDLSTFSSRHSAAKSVTVAKSSPTSGSTSAANGPAEPITAQPSGDQPSMILSTVEPVYPPLARQKGLEGKVKLRAFYNVEGVITEVTIVESSGTKLLDESARKAFSAWKLKSGTAGSFEKTFQFKLNN